MQILYECLNLMFFTALCIYHGSFLGAYLSEWGDFMNRLVVLFGLLVEGVMIVWPEVMYDAAEICATKFLTLFVKFYGCKPGENWLKKQLSRTLSKRFWRFSRGIWVVYLHQWFFNFLTDYPFWKMKLELPYFLKIIWYPFKKFQISPWKKSFYP